MYAWLLATRAPTVRRVEAASRMLPRKHIAAMSHYIWLNSASWTNVVARAPRHMLAMHTLMCPQAVGLGNTVSTGHSSSRVSKYI